MRSHAMVVNSFKKDVLSRLPRGFDLDQPFDIGKADAEGWSGDQVAIALQYQALFKKFAPDGQSPQAVERTLQKFRSINAATAFLPPQPGESESMVYLLNLFREAMWDILDDRVDGRNFGLDFMANHFSAGPGASVQCNSRNFYTKLFDSNHSYTNPYVLALFRAATSASATWTAALRLWSSRFRPVCVSGNSLFTVKKNAEISRTCCTEPLLNMLLQQAYGAFLEVRMLEWGLALDRQPDVNREMAWQGSIDGSFGTTDLTSASDSVALALCEWACPPSAFKWMRCFRSETVSYPDGSQEELKMIGTMGNGFTFPLETIIFASAIRAVYQSKGLQAHFDGKSRNAAVFGDDIIVRKDCFVTINDLLRRLGFAVNESKSFNTGSFRESCGFDYWNGRNVRPVYIESLQTPQDVYSTFNRLSRWSAENLVPLGQTLFCLSKMARPWVVPFSWADDSGFKVPERTASGRTKLEGDWRKFKYLAPISTVQLVPRDLSDAKRRGYKDFNPPGWELCYLGGYARNPLNTFKQLVDDVEIVNTLKDDGINRRPKQGEVLPRERRTSTIPYWDWFGHEDQGRFGLGSFQAWKSLVALVFD